jgi:D-alanyl-D-alanine carboxypeptidase/D-alanyl-D-alanine-endopeptidase (penicillin-binding protein 4)
MWRIGIAACIALPLAAQPPAPGALERAVEAALAAPGLQRALWGIHVRDLATGTVLYSRNAALPMTPASVTKLFSSSLALLRLGADHRFRTRVLARGEVRGGTLAGDLILEGGGDPTLSPREIPYRKGAVEGDPFAALRELAAQVAASGIRAVRGDVVGDDTLYPWDPYPEGWSVDDPHYEYGAAVSALAVNENSLRLLVRPGRRAGEPAEIALRPALEYYTIHNHLRTLAGAPRRIRVERAPGPGRLLRVWGTAPPGAAESWHALAADDPALFAALAFREVLLERGIAVRGPAVARRRAPGETYAPPVGTPVAERVSPPLIEILRVLNKVSHNLTAEIVFLETARLRRGDATRELALEELATLAAETGAAREEIALQDGSGLSRKGLVSPQSVTALLAYMHASGQRDAFLGLLPIGGEDGTLSTRFRSLPGAPAIRAKTGTVSHVNALAGYAGPDPARRAAFAILANHSTAPAAEIRRAIDTIAIAILDGGYR